MSDRNYRNSKRSGDEPPAWDDSQYAALPKRNRARKQISGEAPYTQEEVELQGRRKLSRKERERLRERYEERHAVPPSVRAAPPPAGSSPWRKIVVFGLFAILIGSIGAGRLLTGGTTPTPTPSPTAQSIAVASIELITPSPTATSTSTSVPTQTPSPTPSPTPNPAYQGIIICLDPGHGGSDRGYTREENDIAPAMEEAFYNLSYARTLRNRLEVLGFTVVMTRDADVDVNQSGADVNGDGKTYEKLFKTDPDAAHRAKDIDELQARIDVCNDARADLLISMHINGFTDPSASGYETWFSSARPFTPLNKRFAELAFEELGKEMVAAGYDARPRAVNDDADAHVEVSADAFDRYVITGPDQPGQIVASAMPGSIVEVLFISNDEDARFLASPEGRVAIVNALENAIVRYFDKLEESNGQ